MKMSLVKMIPLHKDSLHFYTFSFLVEECTWFITIHSYTMLTTQKELTIAKLQEIIQSSLPSNIIKYNVSLLYTW